MGSGHLIHFFLVVSYKVELGATLLGVEVIALEVGERDEEVDDDEEQGDCHKQRENEQ